jgi:hypothetical protein
MPITIFIELDTDCMDRDTALILNHIITKTIATNTEYAVTEWGWNQGWIGTHIGAMETMDEQYSYPEQGD